MSNRIIGVTTSGNDQVTLHVQDLNGDIHYMDVDNQDLCAYEDGELIQNCFPYLTVEQREIIVSGMTQDMWDEMFGEKNNK